MRRIEKIYAKIRQAEDGVYLFYFSTFRGCYYGYYVCTIRASTPQRAIKLFERKYLRKYRYVWLKRFLKYVLDYPVEIKSKKQLVQAFQGFNIDISNGIDCTEIDSGFEYAGSLYGKKWRRCRGFYVEIERGENNAFKNL